MYNRAPTNPPVLTQRQYNKGDAAQGHPGEGPRDGQHAVGDGGGAQHPKYDGAHKRQQEHGFPSEPVRSTGWVTAAGNLSQEQGLKQGKAETWEEKNENIACPAKSPRCDTPERKKQLCV